MKLSGDEVNGLMGEGAVAQEDEGSMMMMAPDGGAPRRHNVAELTCTVPPVRWWVVLCSVE